MSPVAVAEQKLPSAQALVAEALRLCPEATEENSLSRYYIAEALANLGDFDAARNILSAHKNDLWIEAGYWALAEAEIARGQVATPFSKALFDELPDYPHLILAKAYAEHGQTDRALEHVKEMPATRLSSLSAGAYPLVQILKKGGHEVAAREVLIRWSDCLANAEFTFEFRSGEKVEPLLGWLHESGEAAKAAAICGRPPRS